MDNKKSYPINDGMWIIYLALFSLGIDGLAYLIYVRDRAAVSVCIPILLIWQAVVFVYSVRSFLPAYRSFDQADPERSGAYMHLFQIAQTLPAIIAIIIWALISKFSRGPH